MTIKSKSLKVLSWALCATLVSAIAWAAVGWKVDGYGNIKAGRSTVILSPGQTSNCKLDYTGSTLSILGADGNALSASNPCIVQLSAATRLTFTSPVSSTFGAASDTDGNSFGMTSSVAWATDYPLYGFACNGTVPYFAFGRIGNSTTTGAAAADMCQEGDTDCDAQIDKFIMTSGLTLANEVNKVCKRVFSFRAQKTATTDQWTVTTLVEGQDGFGTSQKGIWFNMPAGQNGSANTKYFQDNGGTAPGGWATQEHVWTLDADTGYMWGSFRFMTNDPNGVGGAGVELRLSTPFTTQSVPASLFYGTAFAKIGGGVTLVPCIAQVTNNGTYVNFIKTANGAEFDNGDLDDNADTIWGSYAGRAY